MKVRLLKIDPYLEARNFVVGEIYEARKDPKHPEYFVIVDPDDGSSSAPELNNEGYWYTNFFEVVED